MRRFFWALCIIIGALEAWTRRHHLNQLDAISYLDMGDAYFRGDWNVALNGLWSPFYSWMLGLALAVIKPSPFWEFPTIQLVNFAAFVFALFCFDFFLRELIRGDGERGGEDAGESGPRPPEMAWMCLGYSLFIWSSLRWIYIFSPCPDMTLAAFIYAASALLLRIRRGEGQWRAYALLGLVLGFGYLTKSAMFIMSFVFLAMSLFCARDIRRAAPRALIALAAFLLVAAPFAAALSNAKGRLTFSDAGRLNYIWHVNDFNAGWNHWPHWKHGVGDGAPEHPARRLFGEPAVYEFGEPVGGTYPMWYDPSYWFEGVRPRFSLTEQKEELKYSATFYYEFFFFDPQSSVMAGLLLLIFVLGARRLSLSAIARHWYLLIPAVAAMGMYALVHLEPRYIAAYVVVLWMGLFSGLYPLISRSETAILEKVAFAIMAVFLAAAIFTAGPGLYHSASNFFTGKGYAINAHWQVADELMRMGLRPQDRVGIIGSGQAASRWARLARVKIVAETTKNEVNKFWAADDPVKSQVIDAFSRAGVAAIVAEPTPGFKPPPEWQKIESGNYYVRLLPR